MHPNLAILICVGVRTDTNSLNAGVFMTNTITLVWRASLGFPVGFLFVFSSSFVLAFAFKPCSFVDFHDLCASSLFGFQRRFYRFPLLRVSRRFLAYPQSARVLW